jgi:predicted DsbA family dithiol-disulfide isomerase
VVVKPLVVHPQTATIPALAACAASRQGKFGPMDHLIWEKGYNANRDLSEENMLKLAGELLLDPVRFRADMDGEECKRVLKQNEQELRALGVHATPGFFINGRFLSGAQPIENFKRLIDEELRKANDAIGRGVKVEDYYSEAVLKAGKKSM